jgi:hypothetical protein
MEHSGRDLLVKAKGNLAEARYLLQLHKLLSKGKGTIGTYQILWNGTKRPRPK